MLSRTRRLAALVGSAAMALSVVAGSVSAAGPAKLTAIVATDDTGTPASGQAWIRVLHASPDAPNVDVFVDASKVLTNVAFGDISAYTPVSAAAHAIKVCATADNTICPIDVPSLSVADGKKYTIAATNMLASIEVKVIEDAPASSQEDAQIRVVHFSSDTPAVDVINTADDSKLVTNLAYGSASTYLAVPGATYNVKVCANADNTVCPLGPLPLTVAGGTAYSVFAIGSLDSLLATMPPTDTMSGSTDAPVTGSSNGLIGLFLVGVTVLSLSMTLATRRSRR